MSQMNINEQIDALCNGELTKPEQLELMEVLQEQPELTKEVSDQLRIHQTLAVVMGNDSENLRVIQATLALLESNKTSQQCVAETALKIRNSPNNKLRSKRKTRRVKKAPVHSGGSFRFIMSMAASIAIVAGAVFFFVKNSQTSSQQVIAKLVYADSEVSVQRAGKSIPVSPGMSIIADDVLLTQLSDKAEIKFSDETVVHVAGETQLDFRGQTGTTRTVDLNYGHITAKVTHQKAGHSILFKTPNAKATILGTIFDLRATEEETVLSVSEGVVRLTANSNGKSIDVTENLQATVSKTGDIAESKKDFVLGVNINGDAVTIDGNKWLSEADALSKGMKLLSTVEQITKNDTLVPAVDAATSAMLNSCRWMRESPWDLEQTIANGEYLVYVWVVENAASNYRSFDIEANGAKIATDIGRLEKNHWAKYGPFPASVSNGKLELKFIPRSGDAHLMGIAIFRKSANPFKK